MNSILDSYMTPCPKFITTGFMQLHKDPPEPQKTLKPPISKGAAVVTLSI